MSENEEFHPPIDERVIGLMEPKSSKILTMPAFILSMVLSSFPIMLLSLFITDMADMFGLEVGVMGIVRSLAETGSVVMGLLLSGLSVKYSQKSLLAVGIAVMCVSMLALGFVSAFPIFLVLFVLFGLSKVSLTSMSNALVGQIYTVEERPKTTAYLMAGVGGSYVVGSTLAIYLPNYQLISLLVLFPLSALTLFFVLKGVPSTSNPKENPLNAFREVLRNRSARTCLLSAALSNIGPNPCYLTFVMPFFLQTFQADKAMMSMVFMIGAIIGILTSVLAAGRLINRFGRKRLAVITNILTSVLCVMFMSVPSFELSLMLWFSVLIVLYVGMPASNSLALEQLPKYQGTMMSLNGVARFGGSAVGSGVGGLILIVYGFSGLALFSMTGVLAGILYQFFTIDPTISQKVKLELRDGEQ